MMRVLDRLLPGMTGGQRVAVIVILIVGIAGVAFNIIALCC